MNDKKADFLTPNEKKDILKSIGIFSLITIPVFILFCTILFLFVLKNHIIPENIYEIISTILLLIAPFVLLYFLIIQILDYLNGKVELVNGIVSKKRKIEYEDFTKYLITVNKKVLDVSKGWYEYLNIGSKVETRRTYYSHTVLNIKV